MKLGTWLEKRRESWSELEALCDRLQSQRGSFRGRGADMARFSALYRGACSDLALADTYQLPIATIEYLHRLVGRAHNQLYRSQPFQSQRWLHSIFTYAPQQIFRDPCVKICSILFFGLFTLSAYMASSEERFPKYAEQILGTEMIEQMEEMYSKPLPGNLAHYLMAAAMYIKHNTSIGLQCFGLGPLILPTLSTLGFNAVYLGAVFGYMARADVESGTNFFQFVTAHGPFELTAIVLSAAAGLRLGVGLVMTLGLRRFDSLQVQARAALPVIMAAVILFFLAALTEGFISPSPLPYAAKAFWAIMSSTLMMFYFVVLGFPRAEEPVASGP
jgi:uncharacterized membrane protein SpoIIM required for sporulation